MPSRTEQSGLLYGVKVFEFELSRGFSELKSPIVQKLGGFNGEAYDEEGNPTKSLRANATTVAGVKARLRAMGIPQSAD